MVIQMSAASPSQYFHSGKTYVKKMSVYFLAICAKLLCKTDKFKLEVVNCGYFRTILISGQPLTYLIGKSQLSTKLLFLYLYENCFTLVNNNIY